MSNKNKLLTFITACGRPDLLAQTLDSLLSNQQRELMFVIHEDSTDLNLCKESRDICKKYPSVIIQHIRTNGIGQHASIEKFLKYKFTDKYYLHCEEDWLFQNYYDWITESIILMEEDQRIIKTLARIDREHPTAFDKWLGKDNAKFGYLEPWVNDNIKWHGFSWNPGITRLDYIKNIPPFDRWEQEVSQKIYNEGYKTIQLSESVYEHIGNGRSTH